MRAKVRVLVPWKAQMRARVRMAAAARSVRARLAQDGLARLAVVGWVRRASQSEVESARRAVRRVPQVESVG